MRLSKCRLLRCALDLLVRAPRLFRELSNVDRRRLRMDTSTYRYVPRAMTCPRTAGGDACTWARTALRMLASTYRTRACPRAGSAQTCTGCARSAT
eukprot:6208434-Pleurochrysis_carterae.AAC.1